MRPVRKNRGRNKERNDFFWCFVLKILFFFVMQIGVIEEKLIMSESVGVIGMIQIIEQILTKINEDRPNFFGRSNSNRYFPDI